MSRSRCGRSAVAVLALALAVAGCGDDEVTGELAVLRVVTGDHGSSSGEYHFDLPTSVAAGAHRVDVVNEGDEPHHAQILRFSDDSTMDDLTTALAAGDPSALLDVGTFVGGTGLVSPGGRSQADAVIDLASGRHVLMCFVTGDDGTPHVASGMVEPFEVTGSDDPAEPPVADVDVELVDDAFDMPGQVDGGATLAVTNASRSEPHEMVILRVDDGVGVDDVVDAFHAGEALPGDGVGGLQAIPPGTTQHLRLDLPAGRYLVLCAVPSAGGGAHLDEGMIEEVTVT